MNRLRATITVFFILTAQNSWSMLVPQKLPRPFFKKLSPVLSRSFHEHLEIRNKLETDKLLASVITAETFMHSLGKQTLSEMGDTFHVLPEKDKNKVMRCLNVDQKLWLRIGMHKDLDFYVLSELCNGNKKVASLYCKEPLNKVLESYARAKEMVINAPPRCFFKEQHYMMLTQKQVHLLLNAAEIGTIHNADIQSYMDGLNILQKIDPKLCNINTITDTIKLYPSLHERARIFCNIPHNIFLDILCWSGAGITLVACLSRYHKGSFLWFIGEPTALYCLAGHTVYNFALSSYYRASSL